MDDKRVKSMALLDSVLGKQRPGSNVSKLEQAHFACCAITPARLDEPVSAGKLQICGLVG